MHWLLIRWWFWGGLGFMLFAVCAAYLLMPVESTGPQASRQVSQRPVPLPGAETEADRETILQTVLCDILTSPLFQSERFFYGGAAKNRVALIKDSPIAWPVSFPPDAPGFQLLFDPQESFEASDRGPFLGLRVDKLDLKAPFQGPDDSHVEITVFNIGGAGNDVLIAGGCRIRYEVKRLADKWRVQFVSMQGQ